MEITRLHTTEPMFYDELNLGRLCLISIQGRVSEETKSWSATTRFGEQEITVRCAAQFDRAIPHGIDNEVYTALIALFQMQGCPESNSVHTSVRGLLKLLDHAIGGRQFDTIRLSLSRMQSTNYEILGWRDHQRGLWSGATFRLIEHIYSGSAPGEQKLGRFTGATQLELVLPKAICRSIRSGYLKPMDLAFMTNLHHPTAGALYRLLDAFRYDPITLQPQDSLTVNLLDWGQQCRMTTERPDGIRRALQSGHDELIAKKFLRSAVYQGRGAQQTLTYTFMPAGTQPLTTEQVRLVSEITVLGVSRAFAQTMVRTYSGEVLHEKIRVARHFLSVTPNVRNKGGFARDILNDQDGKYTLESPTIPTQAVPQRKVQQQEDAQKAILEHEAAVRTLLSASPAEQWRDAKARLMLMFKKRLSAQEWLVLEQRCLTGEIRAAELANAAVRASAQLELEPFLTELKNQLSEQDCTASSQLSVRY